MIVKTLEAENGFELKLSIEPDLFCTPDDYDGMTPKQIEAWNNDEWHYVCATVTASRLDIELGSCTYGGIEYGNYTYTDDDDNVTGRKWIDIDDIADYVGSELSGEAIWQAEQKITELSKTIQEDK